MSYLVLNQPWLRDHDLPGRDQGLETGDLNEAKALLESLACEGLFARGARNVASLADLGDIRLMALG